MSEADEIRSLSDVMEKLDWLEKHFFGESEWTHHKTHSHPDISLTPASEEVLKWSIVTAMSA